MQSNHNQSRKIPWGRYVVSFIITAALFGTVFFVSNLATNKRLDEMRSIQDKITTDLLSSETQFALLSTAGCMEDGNSILAPELGEMGERLSFMEDQLGTDNADVIGLKKYYSLLQIKDYMLMKELANRCHTKPVTIVYFYTNDCEDCMKQGYVLTALAQKYPSLRIYSLDAGLDLSAIKTMQTVLKVPDTVPSLVINGKVYAGFKSIEELEKAEPKLEKLLPVEKKAPAATIAQ